MASVNLFVKKEGLDFPPKTVVPSIKCRISNHNYNYLKSLKTSDVRTKELLECDAVLHNYDRPHRRPNIGLCLLQCLYFSRTWNLIDDCGFQLLTIPYA